MTTHYIRIWQPANVEQIKEHLMIAGDLSSDCAKCQEVGLNLTDRSCSNCGTDFLFIASRQATGANKGAGKTVARIKDRRPDLTFIDYEDFKQLTGKKSAEDFFGV